LITSKDSAEMLEKYDLDKLAIGTLGSHSALNIFKGAKEEGFRTVCVCTKENAILYKKFPLVDEMIIVKDFTELLSEELQKKLRRLNVVLIPHGSFTAYLSTEQLTSSLYVPCSETANCSIGKPTAKNKQNGCVKLGFGCLQPSKRQMKSTA